MFRKSQKIDRRQHPRRLLLNPQVIVSWGDSKTDLLFDISPGGISVYGILPWKRGDILALSLELPGEGGLIKSNVRLGWTSTSRCRTGICFVDLDDSLAQHLHNWIRLPYFSAKSHDASRPESAEHVPA